MLPNAVFSWAATRSGKGLGDSIASLTPEREEEWLRAYNEWAAEKSLKTVFVPVIKPTPKPTPRPSAEEQDELVELMESVADRLDQEAQEEAEELKQTLQEIDSIDVDEAVPVEIIPAEDDEAFDEHTGEFAAEPVPKPAAEPAVPTVIDDAAPAVTDDEPVIAPEEENAPEQALPIEQRISKLGKDATPSVYAELLTALANDVGMAKDVTEAVIRDHTKRHRGTAAQRLFLAWLNEKYPVLIRE